MNATNQARERVVQLVSGAATHVGSVRRMNEDAFLVGDTVCVVADGMGGYEAGEVASQLVVDVFAEHADERTLQLATLETLLHDLNTRIRAVSDANGTAGMGTTVVGVAVIENGDSTSVVVFNVGDSRCYRLGPDGFVQVTVDHSHVQELVDAGRISAGEARRHPMRNVVTRALGSEVDVRPDFVVLEERDCRLLLCSDGLSGELQPTEIRRTLETEADPHTAALTLVERVLTKRASDNITAVVVDVSFTPGSADDEQDTTPSATIAGFDSDITAPRAGTVPRDREPAPPTEVDQHDE